LTPERIERVLAEFRDWFAAHPEKEPAPRSVERVDLQTLVSQFTALRHEVNLQTKAARAGLEQNSTTLQQLTEVVNRLDEPAIEEEEEEGDADEQTTAPDPALKPLMKAVVDIYDSLALAMRQVEKQKESISAGLGVVQESANLMPPPAAGVAPRAGFWQRLFGADAATTTLALADWHRETTQALKEREQKTREACHLLQRSFDSLLTGYAMSLNRIEHVLPQLGLEAMICAGERFDPEFMEVVEVVTGGELPPGEVVDEVRRGYLWNGTIFRYAQVRVAR